MSIVIAMNRASKRAWAQRMRRCPTVAERVRYGIVLAWAVPGSSARSVAAVVGCSPSSAVRLAHRYLAAGEAGLADRRQYNGTRKATDDLADVLRQLVQDVPPSYGWARPTWTIELLRQQLAAMTGRLLSLTTVRRLLRPMRARRKRPRPTVRCPWPVDQRLARCAALRRLWQHPPIGSVVLFEDEVAIHRGPKRGPDWMLVGTQKEVVTPGTNAKRYLAGALNAETGQVWWVSGERKTSELFLRLVATVLDRYPVAATLHLILDNYGIHTSKAVQAALQTWAARVRLHFVPPYTPSENRSERLWLDLHAAVTRNHRHTTIEALLAAVDVYLTARNLARRRRHLAA
jgi:transposase